tara:strand:- start:47 stop:484 length:438 start_codon:yes stop_codon:yes gene_type:complete
MLEQELIKDFNKYINKKLQPLKKVIQGKEHRIFTILIVLQWVIIIFLLSTKAEDGHSHDYEYAEDGHYHEYAEDGHSHDSDVQKMDYLEFNPKQFLWESQRQQFQSYYDKDENHTHSAEDIEYGIWTLESKIREIDNAIFFLNIE